MGIIFTTRSLGRYMRPIYTIWAGLLPQHPTGTTSPSYVGLVGPVIATLLYHAVGYMDTASRVAHVSPLQHVAFVGLEKCVFHCFHCQSMSSTQSPMSSMVNGNTGAPWGPHLPGRARLSLSLRGQARQSSPCRDWAHLDPHVGLAKAEHVPQ